jgi:hypothetical protein
MLVLIVGHIRLISSTSTASKFGVCCVESKPDPSSVTTMQSDILEAIVSMSRSISSEVLPIQNYFICFAKAFIKI